MATATLTIRDVSDLEEQNAGGFYDEIEIEDMEYDEDLETFFYPCPCGDRFQITLEEIEEGEDVVQPLHTGLSHHINRNFLRRTMTTMMTMICKTDRVSVKLCIT